MNETVGFCPEFLMCISFLLPVMNLDRVETQTHVRRRFPRYHTTLFRGQSLWDPYTHIIMPPTALVAQRQQHWKERERTDKECEKHEPVDEKVW